MASTETSAYDLTVFAQGDSMLRALTVCLVVGLASPALAATTYTYDALGRVSSVTYSNGKTITYTYDAAGNRTQVTQG